MRVHRRGFFAALAAAVLGRKAAPAAQAWVGQYDWPRRAWRFTHAQYGVGFTATRAMMLDDERVHVALHESTLRTLADCQRQVEEEFTRQLFADSPMFDRLRGES